MTTAPSHPGRAWWRTSRLGVKTAGLLSRSTTSSSPLDMCAPSKPAGSRLQDGESHFEGSAATAFGTGSAILTRTPAPMLEGSAVLGQGFPRRRQGLGGTTQPQGWRPGSCRLCRPGCTARQVNQHHCDAQSRES